MVCQVTPQVTHLGHGAGPGQMGIPRRDIRATYGILHTAVRAGKYKVHEFMVAEYKLVPGIRILANLRCK